MGRELDYSMLPLLSLITSFPVNDLVSELPGWDHPLPSRMFSGYIDSNEQGTMHTHYMFMESENNPASDPLVLWFNGGPGAASMFGQFVELGPLLLSDASLKTAEYNRTGVPTLFRNDYAWTKISNLLVVNAPPPVGFSYCDEFGPAGNGTSCGSWNDSRTAVANHLFLKNWMKAFPEYANHNVFVTGESYAGVYVPTLVREIIDDPQNKINIRGFAVGDACVGTDVLCGDHDGPLWHIQFLYGHGQFSTKLFDQITATCSRSSLIDGHVTPECSALLSKIDNEVGGYYEYNLYDECWYENDFLRTRRTPKSRKFWGGGKFTGALDDYACGGSNALRIFVNNTAVRKAINVPLDAYFFNGDDGQGFVYNLTENNLMPFYRRVATNTSLRVLVYNGDTDPGINSFISQNWTQAVGLEEIEEWRPWTLDGDQRMGGYVTRYQGNFDFLTIRGSGHMVPEFKPPAALEFLSRWLNDEEWRRYNPSQPLSRSNDPLRPRTP
eukprot:c8977_g2_i1.p1 GENE.c8977_g2_i1~~c8977_g2_i1.p1  ORF type:complete len:497 (+),score=119.52 c8977_g2_i1:1-1491(+)